MKKYLWLALLIFASSGRLWAQSRSNFWTIKADSINPGAYYGATVANGMIGITTSAKPLQMDHVMLDGVYDKYGHSGVPRMMKGFNFAKVDLKFDGKRVNRADISELSQQLNMKQAYARSHFQIPGKATVTYTVRALRQLPFTSLIVVKIHAKKSLAVSAGSVIRAPSLLHHVKNEFSKSHNISLLTSIAQSPTGKYTIAVSNSFIFNEKKVPAVSHTDSSGRQNEAGFHKKIPKGTTYRFAIVSSQTTTEQFADPAHEAERLTIHARLQGLNHLIRRHRQAWKKLWSSRIIVRGNASDQRAINFALYNLYSYIRRGTAYSISPMGLSSPGYNGHIFWDAEIWMYPSLLVLHPQIAKSMLNYRYKRLKAAKQKARANGFRGAMFPWESDGTGQEATPVWALTGPFEQHITADIAIACWNYFRVTHDMKWLKNKGYPILKAAANFWVSRATQGKNGQFHIDNVVAADEWAANINDDAFTNGAAKKALIYAKKAARKLGQTPDPKWQNVARHLAIHTFDDGVVREYASYNGKNIKQADVNLLSYPLHVITKPSRIKRDLQYYEPKVGHGPAMSYSVFSLLWSHLGNASKAYQLFLRSYKPNEVPPFGALAETAGGTNPYFATGAGGMLQAVLFGFGGLKITSRGIRQTHSVIPKQWKSVKIVGAGIHNKTFVNK
ncbi:MAG TPA: hypothetical protein VE868_04930 [Balneolaceae bacterium]|nr:hypothetical protein [Balneolaceae bacterium]